MTIRKIEVDDRDQAFELVKKATQASLYPIGPTWSASQVYEACSHLGWVATNPEGLIEGLIFVGETPAAWEVEFLATHPNAQRRGVMRSILRALVDQKPSDREIWLEVHEENLAARKLYESVGFREVGKRPRYYSDGGAAILYNYG